MTGPELRTLAAAADRVADLLWLLRCQEPEVLELVEGRGSSGYPHYLASRMGLVPEPSWARLVRIVPTSLVEHLLPRCHELDPPTYALEAAAAAAAALRRLQPGPPPRALAELARGREVAGEISSSWAAASPPGGAHGEAVVDAMVLREERAHLHYAAAAELPLTDLELMLVTAAWRGAAPLQVSSAFRWREEEAQAALEELRARGLMTREEAALTPEGRQLRRELEAETDRRVLARLPPIDGSAVAELDPYLRR